MNSGRISAGCALTVASAALAALFMLATIMGDCFPDQTHTCPTDHERNVRLLCILVGTLLANVALWIGLSRVRPK